MPRRTPLVLALMLVTLPAFAQQPPPASTAPDPQRPATQAPETPPAASPEPAPAQPPATPPAASTPTDPRPAAAKPGERLPLEEIRRFVAVYNAVREAYVEPVDDARLMQSAVRGLLLDLDPHSTYFERSAAEDFDQGSRGAYEGVGVELQRQEDGTLKVVAPIDGTPAARAGLRSGDRIIAIDGKPFRADEGDTSAPLRGPAGTTIVLTIVREGRARPFDVPIVRETIRIASVRARMLEPGYGYARISAFQTDTAADFERELARLKQEAGGRLRGLVIDLRSNPGGLLTSAVQIADDLLDRGGIVSTRGRLPITEAQFSATPGDRLDGAPVVVLVDAGSASASEVLAGALKDNGRARIVGSRTFGKGSVQTVLPLDNGDSVKLTTARYYTPNGKSIQAQGIVPDVLFAAPTSEVTRRGVAEASLPGHLRGEGDDSQAGDVLEGEAYIAQALAELKKTAPAR